MKIKIKLEDLKKAIAKIESESKELTINISIDGHQLNLGTFDRYDCELEIALFEFGVDFLPKIKKTDILR